MSRRKTPIALFTYNRPKHLERTLASLAQCARFDECDLHIFSDGLRVETHRAGWEEARRVARVWAKKLNAFLVEHPANWGAGVSIVTHVTELCREYGRIIMLEDDLVLNPDFLRFMLEGLDRYENEPKVHQISGYMFPIELVKMDDVFFFPFSLTWGWATWQRAWQYFQWGSPGVNDLLINEEESFRFNLNGAVNYIKILRQSLAQPKQIYDVLWYYAIFSNRGLVVFPRSSLVWNSGLDGSGTFSGKNTLLRQVSLTNFATPIFGEQIIWPEVTQVDTETFEYLIRVLQETLFRKPSLFIRAWHKLRLYGNLHISRRPR